MSANLSLSSVIEKNKIDSNVPMIIGLKIDVVDPDSRQVVETLRVVSNNENLTVLGKEYVASSFEVKIEESTEDLPSASITIIDITQTVQRYMQEYRGGNGTHVTVMFFFAPTNVVDNIDAEFTFDVKSSSSSTNDYSITWQIGPENPLTQPLPSRMQMRERCQWRYKGTECGYSGSLPSCDLSLDGDNGCRTHENQTRFGGYPGIQVQNV